MGRYAQAQRRGSDRADVPPPPAPVLVLGDDELSVIWTWGGDDPSFWQLQLSADGVTEWDVFSEYTGADRGAMDLSGGFYYRIRAVYVDPPYVTPDSNIVFVEPA